MSRHGSEYRGLNPVKRLSHCYCHKITGGHTPGWFEKLLILLIPHFDIIKGVDLELDPENKTETKVTSVYLRRFYLFRSKWFGLNLGDLYLHHIVRSDDDPDPHDHPWGFRGLVLAGGYTDDCYYWSPPELQISTPVSVMANRVMIGETVLISSQGKRTGPFPEKVRPLTTISREATHIHKVIVPEGKTAWTLILTSPYGRDWNFVTETGPVMWRKYLGIPPDVDVGE